MKFYYKPILSVIVLAVLLGYAGCGPDNKPGPSVEEVQLQKLSATWKAAGGDVELDGSSVKETGGYGSFELTIGGTPGSTTFNYSTQGRPALSPWPASGTWSFGSDPEKIVVRDPGTNDQLTINYVVSDTQLELTFDYQGSGEAAKVKGQWVFTLTK